MIERPSGQQDPRRGPDEDPPAVRGRHHLRLAVTGQVADRWALLDDVARRPVRVDALRPAGERGPGVVEDPDRVAVADEQIGPAVEVDVGGVDMVRDRQDEDPRSGQAERLRPAGVERRIDDDRRGLGNDRAVGERDLERDRVAIGWHAGGVPGPQHAVHDPLQAAAR